MRIERAKEPFKAIHIVLETEEEVSIMHDISCLDKSDLRGLGGYWDDKKENMIRLLDKLNHLILGIGD